MLEKNSGNQIKNSNFEIKILIMNKKKSNIYGVEEPATEYKVTPKQNAIGKDFDFDKAYAEGLTVEEARTLSKNKIREWWRK